MSPKASPAALAYTQEQAAALILATPTTMARWRRDGRGPKFIKIGRKVGYRHQDLEDWLTRQTVQNTAQGRPAR